MNSDGFHIFRKSQNFRIKSTRQQDSDSQVRVSLLSLSLSLFNCPSLSPFFILVFHFFSLFSPSLLFSLFLPHLSFITLFLFLLSTHFLFLFPYFSPSSLLIFLPLLPHSSFSPSSLPHFLSISLPHSSFFSIYFFPPSSPPHIRTQVSFPIPRDGNTVLSPHCLWLH